MNTIITIEQAGPDQVTVDAALELFLATPSVQEEISNGAKLLKFRVSESAKSDRSPGNFDTYKAVFYNYEKNYAINATGKISAPEKFQLQRSALQPLPTASELNEALRLASNDPGIQSAIAKSRSRLFPGMPGIISENLEDGSTMRRLPLVLHPTSGHNISEVLAVDLADGKLTRGVATHEPRAEFLHDRIIPIPHIPFPFPVDRDNQDHVWFTIKDADTNAEIWKMLIVRPGASSGLNGSGLELRYVNYKGKRVLYRAHAPIWNVLYENRIQEYRDWTNQESGFDASGTFFKDASGNDLQHFILCNEEPKTVFDTGSDGSFTGVAFFKNPDGSWTISTMMSAGWYRYYMAYTFYNDGTIKPRIGFTTNGTNPYAGIPHYHNCYFRFDFDIESAGNNLITKEQTLIFWDPVTHQFKINTTKTPILYETKINRLGITNYLVQNKSSNAGYRILPATNDGTAIGDPYNFSKGDAWAVSYKENEIDDGVPQLSKPADAQIDKFVNGETIDGKDVVFWYGVHFTHDPLHTSGEKDFGPTLHVEGNW